MRKETAIPCKLTLQMQKTNNITIVQIWKQAKIGQAVYFTSQLTWD